VIPIGLVLVVTQGEDERRLKDGRLILVHSNPPGTSIPGKPLLIPIVLQSRLAGEFHPGLAQNPRSSSCEPRGAPFLGGEASRTRWSISAMVGDADEIGDIVIVY
jgi:hypothetical protein